jgi:hypothetical protein
MNQHLRRLVVVAVCFGVVAAAVAGEVQTIDLDPGVCPNSASILSAVELQKRMTAVVTYLQGGPSPTTAFPCIDSSGAPVTRSIGGLSRLQTLMSEEVCSLVALPAAPVCGLKAGLYRLSCRGVSAADFSTIKSIPASVDGCWQLGASGFFIAGGSYSNAGDDSYDLSIEIDPEPAQLTGALGASTGSTAAGYFINSKTPTTIVRWPGTWTANTSLKAGTPCSTVGLAAWQITTQTIQVNGNYRKCVDAAPAPGPEAARLSAPLAGNNGTLAAAVLVSSGSETAVVKWPAALTPDTMLTAGTFCSSVDLAAGQETTRVIQIHGDYRKCVDPATPIAEPARLTEALDGSTSAAAVFISNGMPTSVVRWPGTWTSNTALKAGTPCSTAALAAGQETSATIQANGNYRKCM